MPILTWKFCVQEGRPYPKFPGMYRGVFAQAGSVAPITAIQMAINGVFEGLITQGQREMNDAETIGRAMAAGATSALLYGPVDLITIHQQKLSLSPGGTMAHISKTYGVQTLWRGLFPTALREAIYTSGYLGLAPVFTKRLMQQPGWEESYWSSAVLGSCAAGVIANLASHPVDTAKTVFQADIAGATYTGFWSTLSKLYAQNGLRSLYLGGLPRVIRGCGAFFIVSSLREHSTQTKTEFGTPWRLY